MPYIVTTKQERTTARTADGHELELHEDRSFRGWVVLSRRAVATLDEARYLIEDALDHDNVVHPPAIAEGWRQLDKVDESGGTVGPLPDGTVIEVARVADSRLAALAGINHRMQSGQAKLPSLIIDAYNAAQGG